MRAALGVPEGPEVVEVLSLVYVGMTTMLQIGGKKPLGTAQADFIFFLVLDFCVLTFCSSFSFFFFFNSPYGNHFPAAG